MTCTECHDLGMIEIDCEECGGSGEGPADGTWCGICHGMGVAELDCEDCGNEPMEVWCYTCGRRWITTSLNPQCPRCGGVKID